MKRYARIELFYDSIRLIREKTYRIIPENWKIYGNNMTIYYEDEKNLDIDLVGSILDECGAYFPITVTHIGISSNAIALKVLTTVPSLSNVKHITLAIAPNHKRKESNDIIDWFPIEPFIVEGELVETRK